MTEAPPEPMRDKSVDSADVLDALVAAIIARMLAVGLCEPVPSESLGAARRWCADAGRPTRFKPSRPSPTDAVRDGSAKLGHPVQNVTREHGLTPLPR